MTHSSHPKYRPDIDGMRAIAIAMVVAFHAFPAMLPGGFTGVDIFFVISGYLISTIIFTNLQNHTFSFADFYARRVKRIFPAMLLVVLSSLVFGWFTMFPPGFHELGKNAFNSLLFIANFTLIKRVGYFDVPVEKYQLLHLWSLCIEEQYYILWPLFAGWIFKRSKRILTWIFILFGISFIANIFLLHTNPVANFYLPFTRFWELLAGSLLAQITLRHGGLAHYLSRRFDFSSKLVSNIFSVYGLGMIVAGMFMAQEDAFPGFWALLPVCGAFLLIDAGAKAAINHYLLGNRWMIAIGMISYPLYLWHWPILSFAQLILPESPDKDQLLGLIMLAVILAALTYLFLEKPLRRTQKIRNKTKLLLLLTVPVLTFALLAYREILPPRLSLGKRALIVNAIDDWQYPGDFNFNEKDNFRMLLSNPEGKGSVMVIGDSHAEQYWIRLQKNRGENAPLLLFATYGGCPPLTGMDRIEDAQYCENFYHYAMGFAKTHPVSNVVFSAYWEEPFGLVYTGQEEYTFTGENRRKLETAMQQFEKDIKELQSQYKKVFIVLSNPAARVYNPKFMISRMSGRIHAHPMNRQAYLDFVAPVREALQKVAANTGATVIDPVASLCKDNLCPVIDENGRPFYKDPDHLNRSYVLEKADYIDQVMEP